MEEPINEASMELGLGDIENSALRLLNRKHHDYCQYIALCLL